MMAPIALNVEDMELLAQWLDINSNKNVTHLWIFITVYKRSIWQLNTYLFNSVTNSVTNEYT